ncbi:MAG: ABC transporter substrate-binding protein [Pseudomonadota bacterium]|uniref:ABC transporter substrate-binding protein n=1 Tax=Fodinicurvata fenggangensis TaxID=1121830 RepID=UPI0005597D52|nr:extracellular solute-binding protein [Fodinicurvata fenggangensis]
MQKKKSPGQILRDEISRRRFMAGAAAVGVTFGAGGRLAWAQEEEKELNFYNWDTYIGETTLEDFREETGINVSMSLFADNDELFARLREGNPGFDVIVPSDTYVERMILADMLMPLDHAKIPNYEKNIAAPFKNNVEFDPGREHSMPYMWGTMGIGFRKSRVGTPDSWKVVFDSDEFAGRIAWISEAVSMMGQAAMYRGYSYNTDDPEEIKAVEEMLMAQKPNVKVIAPDTGQDLLLSGEVDLAVEWSGDIVQVMREDDDLSYIVPKEGGLLWEDCLCIPKDAPHPNNAHEFINYLLDAEVGAEIADFIRYATPNEAARELMPEDYKDNPAIFPPEEVLEECESALYRGEEVTRMLEESWTRILSS